jgi:uncharacterized Zn finger protein
MTSELKTNESEFNLQNSPWWVQRWLELLDSYRFKKRLERARIYAREGNVLSIDFEGAKVLAKVQGSEPEPYQVSLSLEPFSDEDWSFPKSDFFGATASGRNASEYRKSLYR